MRDGCISLISRTVSIVSVLYQLCISGGVDRIEANVKRKKASEAEAVRDLVEACAGWRNGDRSGRGSVMGYVRGCPDRN